MEIYENRNIKDLDGEIWKNIENFPDYQISSYGRVKSFKKYRGTYENILKQRKNKRGYLYVNLYRNGKGKPKRIHKLEFEIFNNYKLKDNECIHHLDENPLNNIINNLQLMTKFNHNVFHNSGENHPNYGKKHPEIFGEDNPRSILTEQDVIQIWKYLSEEILTHKEIAKMFGVSRSTITKIKNNKTWKYLNG